MKNSKWNIQLTDDHPMHVVLFVSRNKDNHDIKNYKERRISFVTKEPIDSPALPHILCKRHLNHFLPEKVTNVISRKEFQKSEDDKFLGLSSFNTHGFNR